MKMSEKGRMQWRSLGLVAVLAIATVQSARLGVAGLIVEVAQADVDSSALAKRRPTMAEVNRVAGYFSESLALVPDNPWALEGLGALDLSRVRISTVPAEAARFAKDARDRFRHGLAQRPASPFMWANLALAKLYLDEIDAEFFSALRHADELGPWEPSTQQVVLFAGLAAWDKLDRGGREAIAGVLERGSLRNAVKMFQIAKSYRRIDLVCPLNGYHSVAGPDCRKAGEPAKAAKPAAKGNR